MNVLITPDFHRPGRTSMNVDDTGEVVVLRQTVYPHVDVESVRLTLTDPVRDDLVVDAAMTADDEAETWSYAFDEFDPIRPARYRMEFVFTVGGEPVTLPQTDPGYVEHVVHGPNAPAKSLTELSAAVEAASALVPASRVVYLDANYPETSGQFTSSVQGALTQARAFAASGAYAEIRLGYKSDGSAYAAADLESGDLADPYDDADATDARIALVLLRAGTTSSGGTTPLAQAMINVAISGEVVIDPSDPDRISLEIDPSDPDRISLPFGPEPPALSYTEDEDGGIVLTI